MTMRIISTAVVLGLSIAGITLAQQTGQQPKDQAKLRAQVVKLRVDIELLELEHDADRAHLKEMMKGMREYESKSPEEVRRGVEMYTNLFSGEDIRRREAREEALKKKLDNARPEDFNRVFEEVSREREEGRRRDIDETIKKRTDDAKALIDRKRKEFARQAAELADKRLELAEVERRYNAG
jgi:hypothetical protein